MAMRILNFLDLTVKKAKFQNIKRKISLTNYDKNNIKFPDDCLN